jgi:hypothetical protein
MFESFLNPGYLLAGAALVSLPIIIHLINRMRFKRVRWAAMEFLLKSQKRNRRRLIIEQLLLLALRCILVLLGVLLVSRYLGFSFAGIWEPQNTLHVVVLDDTPSMTDHWREEGVDKDSFKLGKDLIVKEIAKNAAQARTAQRLVLLALSEPNRPLFDQRLNDQTIPELEKALDDTQCTALHTDLTRGVEAAKSLFDKVPQDRKLLHVISDFRQRDWSEPDAEALNRSLDELGRAGVQINLVDTAHPYRSDLQRTPLYHDNLAIVDLRPETRIAAKDMPVMFTVSVANHGVSERKNLRVACKVNGGQRFEGSVTLNIKPGITESATFALTFDQLGFNQVSANLENEEVGLEMDNVRYAVIEVRRQVPVLIVDGDPTNGLKPGGDTFHVQTLLTAAKGFQVVPRGVSELERPNLDQYANIYLLNVRELSDRALRNLENYVRTGGSVAFFLGDKVRPDFYNAKLYAKGKGLFPAPLADRPFPPVSDPDLEPNLFDGQPKIFLRDPTNPIFADVWQEKARAIFNFLPIKRYFPVPRRQWSPEPGRVEELVTLPNQHSVRDYTGEAQTLLDALDKPIHDEKCERYRPGLENHRRMIREVLASDKPLYELAGALDALLKDPGTADDPQHPSLVDFWNKSDYQTLRGRIDKFRETVQLGDPLVIRSLFGKGRVVVFLTTAGRAWNDWAGGSPASYTYPIIMLELQKYLTSGGGEAHLTVGTPLEIQVDSSRFDAKMHRFYVPESRDATPGKAENKNTGPVDLKEQLGSTSGGQVTFLFDEARKPGMYLFEIPRLGEEAGGSARPEQRGYVFNVDPGEGDLRRASREDLERVASGAKVRNPGGGWGTELANRHSDLSESPWLYLVILLVLVAEQALAVHLSFHLKGSEATLPGPSVRQPQSTAA